MFDPVTYWRNDGKHNEKLAELVLEGDPFVERVVSAATGILEDATRGKHRSFASAITLGPTDVRKLAVKALYSQLKEHCALRYEHHKSLDHVTHDQQIRLPVMIEALRRGTCLDLVLLFLSCLAQVKLWPIYVHVKGITDHSLAACWLEAPEPNREMFISHQRLLPLIDSEAVVVVEATGFAYGVPLLPNGFDFCEAVNRARYFLSDKVSQIGFVLDVQRAWDIGIRPVTLPSIPVKGQLDIGVDSSSIAHFYSDAEPRKS